MPDLIRHPCRHSCQNESSDKTSEIDAQISQVRHEYDRKKEARWPFTRLSWDRLFLF